MMPRTTLSIILVCVSMPYVGSIFVAAVVGPLEEFVAVNTTVSSVLGAMKGKVVLGTALLCLFVVHHSLDTTIKTLHRSTFELHVFYILRLQVSLSSNPPLI